MAACCIFSRKATQHACAPETSGPVDVEMHKAWPNGAEVMHKKECTVAVPCTRLQAATELQHAPFKGKHIVMFRYLLVGTNAYAYHTAIKASSNCPTAAKMSSRYTESSVVPPSSAFATPPSNKDSLSAIAGMFGITFILKPLNTCKIIKSIKTCKIV